MNKAWSIPPKGSPTTYQEKYKTFTDNHSTRWKMTCTMKKGRKYYRCLEKEGKLLLRTKNYFTDTMHLRKYLNDRSGYCSQLQWSSISHTGEESYIPALLNSGRSVWLALPQTEVEVCVLLALNISLWCLRHLQMSKWKALYQPSHFRMMSTEAAVFPLWLFPKPLPGPIPKATHSRLPPHFHCPY